MLQSLNKFLFRGDLAPASGFQSMQFRLLENKLGVRKVSTAHNAYILQSTLTKSGFSDFGMVGER